MNHGYSRERLDTSRQRIACLKVKQFEQENETGSSFWTCGSQSERNLNRARVRVPGRCWRVNVAVRTK